MSSPRLRVRHAAVVLPVALLLGACGGGSTTTPAAGGGVAASPAAGAAAVAPGATLMGRIGTADDPDAFEIFLTADGAPVTTVPAGDYTIDVLDGTGIHNFHLAGPGVDMMTSVGKTEAASWKVTLQPGTYSYGCDPHASSMSGQLTVT